jgi:hypothetical protein
LGTVLSFMMGVTTLSLPSMIMLRKAVKPRLLALFRKKNKKEETSSCCCGGSCDAESMAKAEKAKTEGARVRVLGSAALSAISWKWLQKLRWNSLAWI